MGVHSLKLIQKRRYWNRIEEKGLLCRGTPRWTTLESHCLIGLPPRSHCHDDHGLVIHQLGTRILEIFHIETALRYAILLASPMTSHSLVSLASPICLPNSIQSCELKTFRPRRKPRPLTHGELCSGLAMPSDPQLKLRKDPPKYFREKIFYDDKPTREKKRVDTSRNHKSAGSYVTCDLQMYC